MNQKSKIPAYVVSLVFATLLTVGCAKKTAKVVPPAPPAPQPAPTATLAANPSTVQAGQSSTLTWQADNATMIAIAGLGTVPVSGSREVTPSDSTTYTLTATGAGGSAAASARVTVTAPVAAVVPSPSDEDLFARNVKDVFFDYDKANIRESDVPTVQNDKTFFAQHPNIKVLVEGHCDDRGSEEYNIALGTSRAENLKQALVQNGVPATRIRTVSYGKEKPFCSEDNEACWQQNRVDHFAMDHQGQ
jgi:peptidoglycan-associated lipoprotein